MNNKNNYSGAFSRRRFSNLASTGLSGSGGGNGGYTITAGSANPDMGTVGVVKLQSSGRVPAEDGVIGGRSAQSQGADVYRVTAQPFSGCRFVSWNGDYPAGKRQQNPIDVTLSKNVVLAANFERVNISYTLHVDWNETMGRVTASGNGMQEGSLSAPAGSQVTLEATPKDGYVFKCWTGLQLSGTVQSNESRSITITMPARNLNLTAVFAKAVDNPGGGGGTPGGGTDDGDQETDPVIVNSYNLPSSGSLIDKAVPFVKKWWWAIAIAAWLWYDNRKGGRK